MKDFNLSKIANCEHAEELLVRQIFEDLTENETLDLNDHLKICEHCQSNAAPIRCSTPFTRSACSTMEEMESCWFIIRPFMGTFLLTGVRAFFYTDPFFSYS
mgnify:CR=1 FL=1